jgi:hypothetical protein
MILKGGISVSEVALSTGSADRRADEKTISSPNSSHSFAKPTSSSFGDIHTPIIAMGTRSITGAQARSKVGLCKIGQWGYHSSQKR